MKCLSLVAIILLIYTSVLTCQNYSERKNGFGLLHTKNTKNTTINGISAGVFFKLTDEYQYTKTNGIRLELSPWSIVVPAFSSHITYQDSLDAKFLDKNYFFGEVVNGINISTGTIADIKYNGITLGLLAQYGSVNNGIAIAGLRNAMDMTNGLQLSIFLNEAVQVNGVQLAFFSNNGVNLKGVQIGGFNWSNKSHGIQIGIINKSNNLKGIQIGLWNINNKRKFPFINWNFKD